MVDWHGHKPELTRSGLVGFLMPGCVHAPRGISEYRQHRNSRDARSHSASTAELVPSSPSVPLFRQISSTIRSQPTWSRLARCRTDSKRSSMSKEEHTELAVGAHPAGRVRVAATLQKPRGLGLFCRCFASCACIVQIQADQASGQLLQALVYFSQAGVQQGQGQLRNRLRHVRKGD